MHIRRIRSNESAEVKALHKVALEGTGGYHPGPWDKDFENIEGVYLKNGGEFLVMIDGDKIIGMGAIRRVDDITGEIKRMRIRPDYQRQGHGKAMLDALESRARELGYSKIVLDTCVVMKAAQKFYEKNLFMKYGNETMSGIEVILYEKRLID